MADFAAFGTPWVLNNTSARVLNKEYNLILVWWSMHVIFHVMYFHRSVAFRMKKTYEEKRA